MINKLIIILFLTLLVSCQSTSIDENMSIPTSYPITKSTEIPTVIPTFVETIVPETNTPTIQIIVSPTLVPVIKSTTDAFLESETPVVNDTGAILIDHTSIDRFNLIPDDVIREASAVKVMFRHASVGENLRYGLECLYGNFASRRPNSCSDYYDVKYNSSNWVFQFRGNPGWIEKVNDFVRETEKQNEQFDVFMFTLGYLDALDETTFPEISDEENFQKQYIDKLEALEQKYPDKVFIWWTMSLAKIGQVNTTRFNEMLRTYARENNKILVDLADFESHTPEGVQCLDENQLPVICKNYTEEKVSGHLNELGRERAAKLFWYMMARLTGWTDS